MEFENNKNRTATFTSAFNKLAWKLPFDEKQFFIEAEKAGYAEARIFRAGGSILEEAARQNDRITAQLNEDGSLKRYRFG